MINIDFVNIDNAKLIGRLLPYWARGKKISLLLQALLFPLIMVHNQFKVWVLETYIQCHVTAQKASLEWYLNYKLGSHFKNPSGSFSIEHGMNLTCINTGIWENGLPWSNFNVWQDERTNKPYNDGFVNVFAPAITETTKYSSEDYERDIRNIMSKFMINFDPVYIFIV